MEYRQYGRILHDEQRKLDVKKESFMENVCGLCKKTEEIQDQSELDAICSQCPVEMELRKIVDKAKLLGKIRAFQELSQICEESTEDIIQ